MGRTTVCLEPGWIQVLMHCADLTCLLTEPPEEHDLANYLSPEAKCVGSADPGLGW